ncbi:MAG: ABC transporter permease [Desulfobulbus sp.]
MQPPQFDLNCSKQGEVQVTLRGTWTIHSEPPDPEPILKALDSDQLTLSFTTESLVVWDTRLLIFLKTLCTRARNSGVEVSLDGLPSGIRDLLALAEAVPEQTSAKAAPKEGPISRLGRNTLELFAQFREIATFIGQIILAFMDLFTGKRPFKFRDFFVFIQSCGVESLPIVSLIAVLVGVILSFVGAVQLQMFGAQI